MTPNAPAEQSSSTSQPSRRAVLRTAAWAAPTVVVVGAAPAFATTPGGAAPSVTLTHSPSSSTTTVLWVTNLSAQRVTANLTMAWGSFGTASAVNSLLFGAWTYTVNGSTITLHFDLAPGEAKSADSGWTLGSDGRPVPLVLVVDGTVTDTLDLELPFTVAAGRRAPTPPAGESAGEVILAPPVG